MWRDYHCLVIKMSMRRNRCHSILLLLVPLGLFSCAGLQSGIGLYGGIRELLDDVEPDDRQTAYGLAYEAKAETGGLGFEIGAFFAEDDLGFAEAVHAETNEYFAGVRWDFGPSTNPVRPYIGIGGVYVTVDARFDDTLVVSDDAFGRGYASRGPDVPRDAAHRTRT